MARILDEDYAYSTARIRAIENKLITPQRLDRLLDAETTEDAVKMLVELGYGYGSADVSHNVVNVFEKLLSDEIKKTYALLENILPMPAVITLFMRRNDYLNAKTILKAGFLGREDPGLLADSGNVDPKRLTRMIVDRDLLDLPEVFRKAVLECVDTYGRTSDPQEIDLILDRAMYENMAQDAEETNDPYIADLVGMLHDIANIRIFIRAKFLNKSRDFLSKALLSGSKFPKKAYVDLSDKELDLFFEAIRFTSLTDLAARLKESIKTGADISGVEKILDDYFMEYVRKSKYVAMGVEPVIAYLFYKEAEIRNVRLILTGKINKIKQETIRERLRAGYA